MIKEGYKDGALENINGHNPYGVMRGEKYSLHEGGNKVPFICVWPSRIQHPFVQEQPFIYLDMLATLPSLVGKPIDVAQCNDSKDGSKLFLRRMHLCIVTILLLRIMVETSQYAWEGGNIFRLLSAAVLNYMIWIMIRRNCIM